jgi:aminoglycoside 6'-N-acetyltransferase
MQRDDLPLVADWQAQPHVARWWRQDPALAAVTAKYLPYLDGRVPTGKAELTGRGLGTVAITAFTRLALARYPAADLVAVAVSRDNIASWRALEKSGYRRCWAGELTLDHPSDEGPMYVYRLDRGECPDRG